MFAAVLALEKVAGAGGPDQRIAVDPGNRGEAKMDVKSGKSDKDVPVDPVPVPDNIEQKDVEKDRVGCCYLFSLYAWKTTTNVCITHLSTHPLQNEPPLPQAPDKSPDEVIRDKKEVNESDAQAAVVQDNAKVADPNIVPQVCTAFICCCDQTNEGRYYFEGFQPKRLECEGT